MKVKIKYLLFLFSISIYAQTDLVQTEYEYDNLNRLVKVVFTGDNEKNYVYDDLGNRIALNLKTLSVDSETLKNTITIYPNPTSNFLNIKLPKNILGNNISIKLYDINSRLVKNQTIEIKGSSASINVENLSNGVYLLHLTKENKKWSQLFIKN